MVKKTLRNDKLKSTGENKQTLDKDQQTNKKRGGQQKLIVPMLGRNGKAGKVKTGDFETGKRSPASTPLVVCYSKGAAKAGTISQNNSMRVARKQKDGLVR